MDNNDMAWPCCHFLDAMNFQIGALARVAGYYASEYPEPVRIIGLQWSTSGVNITVGELDGSCPTDGFSIDEIVPMHRSTATSSGDE
jgi:hypothetical protein